MNELVGDDSFESGYYTKKAVRAGGVAVCDSSLGKGIVRPFSIYDQMRCYKRVASSLGDESTCWKLPDVCLEDEYDPEFDDEQELYECRDHYVEECLRSVRRMKP